MNELDSLIEAARPMVYSVAHEQHAQLGGELDELIGDGLVALVEAAHRFDQDRGVPFTAYARHRVRGAMVDGYRRRRRMPHQRDPEATPVEFIPIHILDLVDPDAYPWARWIWHEDGRCSRMPTASSPEDMLIEQDAVRALLAKMAALPDCLRTVVECALSDHAPRTGSAGYDGRWQELAAAEGVSSSRISQRLREVRRRLAA